MIIGILKIYLVGAFISMICHMFAGIISAKFGGMFPSLKLPDNFPLTKSIIQGSILWPVVFALLVFMTFNPKWHPDDLPDLKDKDEPNDT